MAPTLISPPAKRDFAFRWLGEKEADSWLKEEKGDRIALGALLAVVAAIGAVIGAVEFL